MTFHVKLTDAEVFLLQILPVNTVRCSTRNSMQTWLCWIISEFSNNCRILENHAHPRLCLRFVGLPWILPNPVMFKWGYVNTEKVICCWNIIKNVLHLGDTQCLLLKMLNLIGSPIVVCFDCNWRQHNSDYIMTADCTLYLTCHRLLLFDVGIVLIHVQHNNSITQRKHSILVGIWFLITFLKIICTPANKWEK